jgi:hypothetical protein
MSKMTDVYKHVIANCYSRIYELGDAGLNYLDQHPLYNDTLMQHVYNDTVDTLTAQKILKLANMLAEIAESAEADAAIH